LLGLTLLPGAVQADPAESIQAVARRVERLHHQAEQASERYNTVREQMREAREELGTARAAVARQRAEVHDLHSAVAALAVAQFEGAQLDTTAALVTAPDPGAFLSHLATIDSINTDRGAMLAHYQQQRHQLSARSARLRVQVSVIADTKEELAAEKATLDKKAAKAEDLLAALREKRREARLERQRAARQEARREAAAQAAAASRAATRPPVTTAQPNPAPAPAPAPAPSSGRGAAAAAFALGQVGDAYVYGGVGPDTWDCSGLTMGAWAAAGVALPHSAAMQAAAGVPVSVSALQPGDLVFYYSPISHVGLYVGNGQLVHAANPSRPVEVVSVSSMPIATAVRPG
jgi:cell wall-associated NlpC family hydrolase